MKINPMEATLMNKPVSAKMGIKENMRSIFLNAPADAIDGIELPPLDLITQKRGRFDYIHLFVKSVNEFKEYFPSLKSHLSETGMLWVSWPKMGQLGTDLSLTRIIQMGYESELVESTCLSINQTWSALKFTHPKKGKVYNNKYGKLPSQTY